MQLLSFVLSVSVAIAQTYSHCNPMHQKCDPIPALGREISVNFAKDGPNGAFKRTGNPTIIYDSNQGALFNIHASGHNPTLQSKFYIMFGKVTVCAKAAPGAGIVSSIVLQSDTLDEIDVEFVGNDPTRVQTNYYSKGDTSTYDRGRYHLIPSGSCTGDYHDYTVEWTSNHVKWYVDNELIRTLHAGDRPDIFPQTPMNVRIGSWAAGDMSNPRGTVDWAGGMIDYSQAPFKYSVISVSVEDYSTGSNYEYTDHSGSWKSIKAHDGSIGAKGASQGWFKEFVKLAHPL